MQHRLPSLALSFAALLAVVLGGCTQEILVDAAQRQAAIYNGKPYSGHPSVGELQIGSGGLCTATLIGARTVLTAAHCVVESTSYTFYANNVGYAAASVRAHQSYNDQTLANDIGIVILKQAPPIAPSVISTSAPTVGLPITLVGYGVTTETGSDSGTKRIATNVINGVTSTRLTWTSAGGGSAGGTCYGDSGGPAFATINGKEVVVGVTSTGDPPCGNLDYDTRVDAYLAWIVQQANGDVAKGETQPPPPPPPPPPSTDQQPPQVAISAPASGATVPAYVVVTAAISDNVGVVKAQLIVDGKPLATLIAPPWEFQAALAPGPHTLLVGAWDAANNRGEAMVAVTAQGGPAPQNPDPRPDPSRKDFGAPCAVGQDCASGLCAEDATSGSGKYCTDVCNPNVASCPAGAGCFPASGERYVCGPPATPSPQSPNGLSRDLIGTCAVAPRGAATPGAVPAPLLLALLAVGALARPRRRRG